LAVGNDKQWNSMVSQDMFKSLAKDEYKNNKGRIEDVTNLNKAINAITEQHTSEDLIELFTSITVPISKIKNVKEVVEDPLVAKRILTSKDPKTGTKVTLAPPPNMTPFLEQNDQKLSFPPRFGEQNTEIYGDKLGYDEATLAEFKEKGII
ncbi:MAG: CoA transferase, partial [Desulfobacteraceae bacterium]|nr:CoA transferase [Desulfobacteraceae bacterium]